MIAVPSPLVGLRPFRPLLAVLLGLVPPSVAGATLQDAFPLHEPEHLVAVQRGRERELQGRWSHAEAEPRAVAAGILRRGRDPQAPERQPLGYRPIAVAIRELTGTVTEKPLYRWQFLADAIDLRVAPGAFEARSEGRGESMTVHVSTLFDVLWLEGRVDLILFWIGEDGEELRARGEAILAGSFERGFPMYIRPPVSEPGRWRLVAELRTEKGSVRTHAVPVDCVAKLRERTARLAELDTPLAVRLIARLRPLFAFGARSGDALPLAHWFDLVEGEVGSSPLRPVSVAESLGHGGEVWEIVPPEGASPTEVVLILTTPDEHPTDLLHEEIRAAWASSPNAPRRWVVAASLSTAALGDLVPLVSSLRARPGTERLTLVVRGENALFVPGLLLAAERAAEEEEESVKPVHGVDALVMAETSAARVPPRVPLSIPILQIADEAPELALEEGVSSSGAFWRRISLAVPRPVCHLELPGRIDAWSNEK